jgi:outer membrane protein assembly factor BamB
VAASILIGSGASLAIARGADQPQWGHAWDRNLVSAERGLPATFNPTNGLNVAWTAELGTETYSSPIVAGGRVYIGTNNEHPRDPHRAGDRGVLLCLDEKDGHLLWQHAVPKRELDPYYDWPKTGLSSPVTVEGHRVYLVNNRGEVVCLDDRGMANGNDGPFRDEGTYLQPRSKDGTQVPSPVGELDADMLWVRDLTREAGIWSHDGAHASILIDGDFLYLNTSTGVDNTHRVIRTPDAPSLVVLDKHTGRIVAREREGIAPNVFHCTWSSPSMGKIGGRKTLIFAAGNGVLYGFEPLSKRPSEGSVTTLRKLWQVEFDADHPPGDIHSFLSNRREGPSNIYGMPVLQDGRLFVAGGGDWFWGKNQSWLKCFTLDSHGDKSGPSIAWSTPIGRHTMATPALSGGRVYVTDSQYALHCVDASSGTTLWRQDLGAELWASALVADGKVYVGTRRGGFWVFRDAPTPEVLGHVELGAPINSTATAANRTLYVATMSRLYAVRSR